MSNTATISNHIQTERIIMSRLLWVGPLTVSAAVVANLIVRFIALSLLDIPLRFSPLAHPGPVITLTTVGVTGSVIVFAIVSKFAKHPIRLFRIIAIVVLLISFLPDLAMLTIPGISVLAVVVLMLMHVVAAAISVGLLINLLRKRSTALDS
ncbi:MAG: DUF6069 family protein [Acidobacteriota bacterium]